ncbi:MAG: hypothetical protein JW891_06275 [Candidatus Lokiarchaeota archaeon]|nr:hypothetical protein [Candidatus Lokiarchaeota archaeon]
MFVISFAVRLNQCEPTALIGFDNEFGELRTSEEILIDKVYEFTTDNPVKKFEDLEMIAEYRYFLYFKMVTPHQCNLIISIIDPNGTTYDAFNDSNFNQEEGLRSVPFGVAITGGHDLYFEVNASYNVNVYIRIEREIKCLYDVFSSQASGNVILYGVHKFENALIDTQNVTLQSDTEYAIYLARVSPISTAIVENQVKFNYSLTDIERQTVFELNWKNLALAPIGEVTKYSFGTANGGQYKCNLNVKCEYNPVNIAFAIVYDHEISNELEENQTEIIPSDGASQNVLVSLSPLQVVIFVGAFGVIVFGAIVGVARSRKKRNTTISKF